MNDLEFIKKFSKITVKGACEKVGVNRSNLLYNRSTPTNEKLVREELESEIAKLYIKKEEK